MQKAWADGLRDLVPALEGKLASLTEAGAGWTPYVEIARRVEAEASGIDVSKTLPSGYRRPSAGAQPVFLELFVTTVFMRRRASYRRITDRLITAQEDGLDDYIARALAGSTGNPPDVRALWGCRAEPKPASHPGQPALCRLVFPRTLQKGEKHYFSSEAIDENISAEREGVDVEIDHYGIAPGSLMDGHVPISGLTVRVRFDEGYLPISCWWHSEQTERERHTVPPDDSPRRIPIMGNSIQYTFPEKCHPRETYGVSFLWD